MLSFLRRTPRIGALALMLTLVSWLPAGFLVPSVVIRAGFGQEAAPGEAVFQAYSGVSIEAVSNLKGNYLIETDTTYDASLMSSFQRFQGLGALNQAAGNLNNQATMIGFAATGKNNALMTTDITIAGRHENNCLISNNTTYRAAIGGESFKGSTGIAVVNQVAGNMNTQLKAVTINMGSGAAVLNNTQLSLINSHNGVQAQGPMTAQVSMDDGAFQDFRGIASVTQVAGNLNQVATTFRININYIP